MTKICNGCLVTKDPKTQKIIDEFKCKECHVTKNESEFGKYQHLKELHDRTCIECRKKLDPVGNFTCISCDKEKSRLEFGKSQVGLEKKTCRECMGDAPDEFDAAIKKRRRGGRGRRGRPNNEENTETQNNTRQQPDRQRQQPQREQQDRSRQQDRPERNQQPRNERRQQDGVQREQQERK